MKLSLTNSFKTALCILLGAVAATAIEGLPETGDIEEYKSWLASPKGQGLFVVLDADGAIELLARRLGYYLEQPREHHSHHSRSFKSFVHALTSVELNNIGVCIVFATTALDFFGDNVDEMPEACQDGYIDNLLNGKCHPSTVKGIPPGWATKRSVRLIEAIFQAGEHAIQAISETSMEELVKNVVKGKQRLHISFVSLEHLSGSTRLYLTPQFIEAVTGQHTVLDSEALDSATFENFACALSQRLEALHILLDLNHHITYTSGTWIYFEELFTMVSSHLAHFVKWYTQDQAHKDQWNRVSEPDSSASSSNPTLYERRYETQCGYFNDVCVQSYKEIARLLASKIDYIQGLSKDRTEEQSLDRLKSMGAFLHAGFKLGQSMTKLTLYHHDIFKNKIGLLNNTLPAPLNVDDLSPEEKTRLLDGFEELICRDFVGLTEEASQDARTLIGPFERFLRLSPEEFQVKGYEALRSFFYVPCEEDSSYSLSRSVESTRTLSPENRDRVTLAEANFWIDLNTEVYTLCAELFTDASSLSWYYLKDGLLSFDNTTVEGYFDLETVSFITPERMQKISGVKSETLEAFERVWRNIRDELERLSLWVAQAYICVRHSCNNNSFSPNVFKKTMGEVADNILELMGHLASIENEVMRTCGLADFIIYLYRLEFDMDGFWRVVEEKNMLEEGDRAIHLDVSSLIYPHSRLKSARSTQVSQVRCAEDQ